MQPERLEYLKPLDRFYQVLIEQAKQGKINEAEFYLLLGAKCKALDNRRLNTAF